MNLNQRKDRRYAIRPSRHIIYTLTISGAVYLVFKSLSTFFASLVAGILIDLDHILDYCLQQGLTLKVKYIYFWCIEKRYKFLFLFFHSIELVFIIWFVINVFKLGIFWIAFAIGITQHMLLDIIYNRKLMHNYAYFLSYRMLKNFKKENLFKKNPLIALEK